MNNKGKLKKSSITTANAILNKISISENKEPVQTSSKPKGKKARSEKNVKPKRKKKSIKADKLETNDAKGITTGSSLPVKKKKKPKMLKSLSNLSAGKLENASVKYDAYSNVKEMPPPKSKKSKKGGKQKSRSKLDISNNIAKESTNRSMPMKKKGSKKDNLQKSFSSQTKSKQKTITTLYDLPDKDEREAIWYNKKQSNTSNDGLNKQPLIQLDKKIYRTKSNLSENDLPNSRGNNSSGIMNGNTEGQPTADNIAILKKLNKALNKKTKMLKSKKIINDMYDARKKSKEINEKHLQDESYKFRMKSAESKIESLANINYKPGGGSSKIVTQKVDFRNKAQPKIDSFNIDFKSNLSSGNVKIFNQKLNFSGKAQSRVGSLKNINHKPTGGNVRIYNEKLSFSENARSRLFA